MVLGKKWSGTLLALLVVLVMAMLLAAPAWSQEERTKKDGERSKKEATATERSSKDAKTKEKTSKSERSREAMSQRERLTAQDASEERKARAQAARQKAQAKASNSLVGNTVNEEGTPFIELLEILNAGNCNVKEGATIVFEDIDSPTNEEYTVVDNLNVQITDPGDIVEIVEDLDSDDDIEFFDEDGNLVELETDVVDLEVVDTAGINCGNNNNKRNQYRNDIRNDRRLDRFFDRLFDQYNDGEVLDEQYDNTTQEDITDDAEDSDTTTSDTGTDTGFTDPDTQTPVSEPVGNVSNEIPDRSTPLPETGGLSLLTLALPLGVTLVVAGFATLWFGRRRRS